MALILIFSTLSLAQTPESYYKIELSQDSTNWSDITQSATLTVGEKPNSESHSYLSIKGAECKWAFQTGENEWHYFIIDNSPYKRIYIRVSLVIDDRVYISEVSEPVYVYSSMVLSTIVHLFNQ